MNLTELEKSNKFKNNIVERSALEITNSIIKSLISEIRKEEDKVNFSSCFDY